MLCCWVFSAFWRRQRHTFELCDVHAKGVALFEHAFAAALDEVIEALGELGHAFAQVVEAEVDGGEVVGH